MQEKTRVYRTLHGMADGMLRERKKPDSMRRSIERAEGGGSTDGRNRI